STSFDAINSSWLGAGYSGDIARNLYYQVKKKMNLSKPRKTGRKPGRPARSESAAPAPVYSTPRAAAPAPTGSSHGYLKIEQTLDALVADAVALGDHKLAEDLRAARRRVSVKLV
ncbi:MAG: hypothetical protein ACRC1K_23360, partial [Planctomycetia bacterium]